jgi:hypothetical protein
MDRAEPSRRPQRRAVGFQRWRDLLFLHWPIAPAALKPLLPPAAEIDTFDGQAWIGLVAFEMFDVRPAWWPARFAFSFPETNVRTYVQVGGRDPGVFFFSLDAASRLAVHAARLGWGLPYHHARFEITRSQHEVSYMLERGSGPRLALRYELGEPAGSARLGTLDHFLIERYLLHVVRGSRLYTGQVQHAPYPLRRVRLRELNDDLLAAAGVSPPAAEPLVHYADGVDVEIFGLRAQGSR